MESYVISNMRVVFSPRKEPLVYLATLISEKGGTEEVQFLSSQFGVWVYFLKDQSISLAEGEIAQKELQEYHDGDHLQCNHSFEQNYKNETL